MTDKVIVTKPFIGICGMQVCAENDITDKEILAVCNSQNSSGTSNGWSTVVRSEEQSFFEDENGNPADLPIKCVDDPEKTYFIVLC